MAQEEEDWGADDPGPQEEEVWIGSPCCQYQGSNLLDITRVILHAKKSKCT